MTDESGGLQAKMADAKIGIKVPLCHPCKNYREFDKKFILAYGVVGYCRSTL